MPRQTSAVLLVVLAIAGAVATAAVQTSAEKSDVRTMTYAEARPLTVLLRDKVPAALKGQLGIAIAKRTYKAYRDLLASDRWLRLLNCGARSQRLLWASTGTKDPKASDVLYVKSLAAPHSVNTMPEKTLLALADHGEIGAMLPHDGGDAEAILDRFAKAGVDVNALAAELQRDGAAAFVASWKELLACLVDKSQTLKKAG